MVIPDTARFRLELLKIVTTYEDVASKEKVSLNPESYGLENTNNREYGNLIINDGKILLSKKSRKSNKIFEIFIMVIIVLSCIVLAINTPTSDPHSGLSIFLTTLDIIFTCIFLIEAILKIMAFGFFWNHYPGVKAYIQNPWNVIDFIVVILSVVDIMLTYTAGGSEQAQSLSSFKAIRAIRAIRPLRIASRSESLRIAIQALFSAIPAIRSVILIC